MNPGTNKATIVAAAAPAKAAAPPPPPAAKAVAEAVLTCVTVCSCVHYNGDEVIGSVPIHTVLAAPFGEFHLQRCSDVAMHFLHR